MNDLQPGQFYVCEPDLIFDGHEMTCLIDVRVTVDEDGRIEAMHERSSSYPTKWLTIEEFERPGGRRTALWTALEAHIASSPKLCVARDIAAAELSPEPDEPPYVPIRINARVG